MDDRILKYIEHKKLYYEELEEAAKITPEEEKIRDLCLAASDAINKCDIILYKFSKFVSYFYKCK